MPWTPLTTEPDALGESPFWHPDEGRLYWLDIPNRQVRRCDPSTGARQSWTMPSEPGCMAPVRSGGKAGGLVIALRDGIYLGREWGGAMELLAPAQHDPATTRFNDGKADPLGRFWAGTLYEPRDKADASLYCLDLRSGGQALLQRMAGNATVANGLAWSPDGTTLYWGDTSQATVKAWDWHGAANTLGGERVFARWPAKPAGWKAGEPGQPGQPDYGGRPDGAAVDVEGNYYVAMFEGARLLKLSPGGEVLQALALPAQCPTMPCFGGADLKTLYVTTARQNRSADEVARLPLSGCVLSMRVDVPGLPVNFFQGPPTL